MANRLKLIPYEIPKHKEESIMAKKANNKETTMLWFDTWGMPVRTAEDLKRQMGTEEYNREHNKKA